MDVFMVVKCLYVGKHRGFFCDPSKIQPVSVFQEG